MADIFDIVADANRRDILRVLLDASQADSASGEVSVSEIVARLELSQPTVSKHLKVLREAGLVTAREEGQHRYYRLEKGPLETIEDWLVPFVSSPDDYEAELADARAGIADGTREFAGAVGKVLADTGYRVTSAVGRVRRGKVE
jgi:ArsR family transcriptional regulator, arsenate/arsenite/antimonite-responsive transcriptional repressor